ncbi:hypothetical protein GCM10007939_05900 [Amylibacter marinus]|uniref:Component of SufBCD complex n=1 Tax=Amylibacter marinus TaxID=1475483 RepID=A0ABQ5VT23_9RHOB|nr:hypothetical protein [Amylibacter marinus]GLQ34307.1 hypothetical protein GCM10007939_05900 [Amylibacter marinus]
MTIDLVKILNEGSFFNLWYWLFLAVTWSRITYVSVGVPLSIARAAWRDSEQNIQDFEILLAINARRFCASFDSYGVIFVAFISFLLATMGTLGFLFDFEVLQAMFLLLIFVVIAEVIALRFARKLMQGGLSGQPLVQAYFRHQKHKQFLGMFCVTVISIYGVSQSGI